MAEQSSLIFISGGVRSGKSRFAEELASHIACLTSSHFDYRLHYIATGQSSDGEMKARIAMHQRNRYLSGVNWHTWEQSNGLKNLGDRFDKQDVILLDCLTTLLNNEFFRNGERWRDLDFQKQIMFEILEGIETISHSCKTLIVVSNEVFYDPPEDHELVFTYKMMLGKLHQIVVEMAQKAYLVEAGIPLLMKGERSYGNHHDSKNFF